MSKKYAPVRKNKKGRKHACDFECGCTWTIKDWHEMSRREIKARRKREKKMSPIWAPPGLGGPELGGGI